MQHALRTSSSSWLMRLSSCRLSASTLSSRLWQASWCVSEAELTSCSQSSSKLHLLLLLKSWSCRLALVSLSDRSSSRAPFLSCFTSLSVNSSRDFSSSACRKALCATSHDFCSSCRSSSLASRQFSTCHRYITLTIHTGLSNENFNVQYSLTSTRSNFSETCNNKKGFRQVCRHLCRFRLGSQLRLPPVRSDSDFADHSPRL